MFPAVETAAKQGSSIVDGAAGWPQVDAGTFCRRGQQEYAFPAFPHSGGMFVGFDIVAEFGVQEQALAAFAAFRATPAGYFGFFHWRQTPF